MADCYNDYYCHHHYVMIFDLTLNIHTIGAAPRPAVGGKGRERPGEGLGDLNHMHSGAQGGPPQGGRTQGWWSRFSGGGTQGAPQAGVPAPAPTTTASTATGADMLSGNTLGAGVKQVSGASALHHKVLVATIMATGLVVLLL